MSAKWILTLIVMIIPAALMADPAEWKAPDGMKLVWADEFNAKEINLANWKYETKATGWSQNWNNEHQDYTDNGTGGPNAFISNGSLVILAKKVNDKGTFNSYTSARMVTDGLQSFQYGRIAARIKMPKGNGMWPAFWMLGNNISTASWPGCGEIDIIEMIGGKTGEANGGGDGVVCAALHGPGYSGAIPRKGVLRMENGIMADDYHVYSIDWNKDGITWYFDETPYFTVPRKSVKKWPFDQKFYILLNLAIGGNWGKYPDATTAFPQGMIVDWVRVYQ